MCHVCNQSESLFYDNLRDILMDRLESEKIITTIENLGLISEQPIKKKGSPIDTVYILRQGRDSCDFLFAAEPSPQ